MTQDQERSIDFMNRSAQTAGLPTGYQAKIKEGIVAGQKEISLDPHWKDYPREQAKMLWEPKVTESDKSPGRYNFSYRATLVQENKEPVQQVVALFNHTGPTLEQSKSLLQGNSVVITSWDRANSERRDVIASLDMSKTPAEGQNYPMNRIPLTDLQIGRLYSKEDVVATPDQKKADLAALQRGDRVEVTLTQKVNGAPVYYDASLQFKMVADAERPRLEMIVRDPNGNVLRQPSIEAKQENTAQGIVVGMGKDNPMPDDLQKLLAKGKNNGEQQQLPTIPPKGQRRRA